jgi:type IV secretory pathway VirD2 relaxase
MPKLLILLVPQEGFELPTPSLRISLPVFDAETDRAEDAAFADRCQDDRHHFRFIVSPEDAAEMTDLRAFTRDLARQMEADLGTRLELVQNPRCALN